MTCSTCKQWKTSNSQQAFDVVLMARGDRQLWCRVSSAKEVVAKGQEVWVKVVSVNASKVSLSMRDVDQQTGQDLLPPQAANPSSSNPAPAAQGLRGLSGITVKDDDNGNMPRRRPGKRLTSPERWEITQLIKSGVLDVTEYPTFDEEEGVSSVLSFY